MQKPFLQFPPKSQCDIHFCSDLRESVFPFSGRRKCSEVERVTEKNEKREHEKREGALGRTREEERGWVGRVFRCRENHFSFILRACSRMDMFIYAGCLKKHWEHTHAHTHMEPPLTLHAPTVSTISFSAVFLHVFQLKSSLLAPLFPLKVSVLCFVEPVPSSIGMLVCKTFSKRLVNYFILNQPPTEMLRLCPWTVVLDGICTVMRWWSSISLLWTEFTFSISLTVCNNHSLRGRVNGKSLGFWLRCLISHQSALTYSEKKKTLRIFRLFTPQTCYLQSFELTLNNFCTLNTYYLVLKSSSCLLDDRASWCISLGSELVTLNHNVVLEQLSISKNALMRPSCYYDKKL